MARKFRRFSVSSDGMATSATSDSSISFLARGCLTILAVGNTVSGELILEFVAVTTFGFIREVLKMTKNGFVTHLPMQAIFIPMQTNLQQGNKSQGGFYNKMKVQRKVNESQ